MWFKVHFIKRKLSPVRGLHLATSHLKEPDSKGKAAGRRSLGGCSKRSAGEGVQDRT